MMKNDSEWFCSVQCGNGPDSIFHTRFINQYISFGRFEVKILGMENDDVMDLFSQISHYSGHQVAIQLGRCVKEIVAKMLISGCCIYHFEKKQRDWKFTIPDELGGEKLFSKIANFTTEHSLSLLFDILYSGYFRLQYDKNLNDKVNYAKKVEVRHVSSNTIINEE